MSNNIDTINAASTLRNKGLIFEINRTVLHKFGYSLQIEQTDKRFSFLELDEKKQKYIETSLTLLDLDKKLNHYHTTKIEKSNMSAKRKEKYKVKIIEIISNLGKLEKKAGGVFELHKLKFLITREKDLFNKEDHLIISNQLVNSENDPEGILFQDSMYIKGKKRYDDFLKREGLSKLKERENLLGFIVQGEE